jgi:hypothetical protein
MGEVAAKLTVGRTPTKSPPPTLESYPFLISTQTKRGRHQISPITLEFARLIEIGQFALDFSASKD